MSLRDDIGGAKRPRRRHHLHSVPEADPSDALEEREARIDAELAAPEEPAPWGHDEGEPWWPAELACRVIPAWSHPPDQTCINCAPATLARDRARARRLREAPAA